MTLSSQRFSGGFLFVFTKERVLITADHPIFSALHNLEQEMFPVSTLPERSWCAVTPWAIPAPAQRANMIGQSRVLWNIPGFQAKYFIKYFNPLRPSAAVNINSIADALQLRNNHTRIRAFYFMAQTGTHMPVSVKLVKEHDDPALDATHNEIKQRHYVETTNTVTIPRLVSGGTIQDHVYLVEELVKGRRFRYELDINHFIGTSLPELMALYNKSGIEQHSVEHYFPAALLPDLVKISAQYPALASLASYMQKALENHAPVDIALCHGDLVPSNLCVSRGKIYFLDWGMSCRNALIPDILRLAMRYPKKSGHLINAVLRRIQGEEDIKYYGAGFAATLARAITRNPPKAKEIAALWQKHAPRWLS